MRRLEAAKRQRCQHPGVSHTDRVPSPSAITARGELMKPVGEIRAERSGHRCGAWIQDAGLQDLTTRPVSTGAIVHAVDRIVIDDLGARRCAP